MSSQVARTINNMQQQIQQHQRQLAQALLMKQQQQQPPPSHSGLHPGGPKSALDLFPGHPHAAGLHDLQTKEPQSSPNSYGPYSLCEWLVALNGEPQKSAWWARVVTAVCLLSRTESEHECKLRGGGGSVHEGAPPAPVALVAMDASQLHRKPLRKLLPSGAQPGQAW